MENRGNYLPVEEVFEAIWRRENSERSFDPQYVHNAVSVIRRALGESAKEPRRIHSKRGRGVCFEGPVEDAAAEASLKPLAPPPASPVRKAFGWLVGYAGALMALLALVWAIPSRPAPSPKVTGMRPLTHTGHQKFAPVLPAGSDLLYTELVDGVYQVMRVPAAGGEASAVTVPVDQPYLCALSPVDGSLLVRSVPGAFDDYGPFHVISAGGAVAPVEAEGFDGTWTPDGRHLLVTRGKDLLFVEDGRRVPRTIAQVEGYGWWPRWSPDGRRLMLTISAPNSQVPSLALFEWDAAQQSLGRTAVPFPAGAGMGSWPSPTSTVFQVTAGGVANLWLHRNGTGFFQPPSPPEQLTYGPVGLKGPLARGRTIFARGQMPRGELYRFSPRQDPEPVLPGVFADAIAYSEDGRWMAYQVTGAQSSLWLAPRNGAPRTRLLESPEESAYPKWSPDGQWLAVSTRKPGGVWKVSLFRQDGSREDIAGPDGRNVIRPEWRDARRLIAGGIPAVEPDAAKSRLWELDLRTRQWTAVAGSDGLFSPAVNRTAGLVAGLGCADYSLRVLDLSTGNQRLLGSEHHTFPVWSKGGDSLLTVRSRGGDRRIVWLSPKDGREIQARSLRGFRLLDRWAGLSSGGELILARDAGIHEIFAVDLDRPLP